jgi:tryptophanyl-tRNA synthetase
METKKLVTRGELDFISREQKELKLKLLQKEQLFYEEKIEKGNLKSTKRFAQYHPNPPRQMLVDATFAHRDLETIAQAMADKTPWAVVSGLNPSGPLHFGHKVIFDQLLWYQQQGADVFIPITNDETYVVGKANSLKDSRRIAYEEVIPSIIAMGFDSQKTHIYVDSDYPEIYNVAMELSKHISLNKIFGVFGFDKEDEIENAGTLFYRAAVQISQILLPQYLEFGGQKPTLIPVGVDQIPYLLLARDVAKKKEFIPPAQVYSRFQFGLDGKGKMSASRPESVIFLTDSLDSARQKLKTAYTGGLSSAQTQTELGGVPQICPIAQMQTYNFLNSMKMYDDCSGGKLLCGSCKNATTQNVVEFLEDHQQKREKAKTQIDQYLLRTKINSILEY